jgi:hypothetical protein
LSTPNLPRNSALFDVDVRKFVYCILLGYGSTVTCARCQHAQEIRQDVTRNTQKQAERMMDQTARRLVYLAIGSTVMVPVPEIDRGRAEFPNIKSVVMKILVCTKLARSTAYSIREIRRHSLHFLRREEYPAEQVYQCARGGEALIDGQWPKFLQMRM